MKHTILKVGSIAKSLDSPREFYLFCIGLLNDLDDKLSSKHKAKKIFKIACTPDFKYTDADKNNLNRAITMALKDLNKFAPPFTYIGHHPTDQSHLGVWLDLGKLREAETKGAICQGTDWKEAKRLGYRYVLVCDLNGSLSFYRTKDGSKLWTLD